MILLGLIDRRADKRQRELFSGLDIVRAAADLEGPLLPCVDRCQVEVRALDRLAGLNQADHNAGYILSDLVEFLHLKSASQLSGASIIQNLLLSFPASFFSWFAALVGIPRILIQLRKLRQPGGFP